MFVDLIQLQMLAIAIKEIEKTYSIEIVIQLLASVLEARLSIVIDPLSLPEETRTLLHTKYLNRKNNVID